MKISVKPANYINYRLVVLFSTASRSLNIESEKNVDSTLSLSLTDKHKHNNNIDKTKTFQKIYIFVGGEFVGTHWCHNLYFTMMK